MFNQVPMQTHAYTYTQDTRMIVENRSMYTQMRPKTNIQMRSQYLLKTCYELACADTQTQHINDMKTLKRKIHVLVLVFVRASEHI